jgi:hypothetical protein
VDVTLAGNSAFDPAKVRQYLDDNLRRAATR